MEMPQQHNLSDSDFNNSPWEHLLSIRGGFQEYEFPPVSIIIPTYNNSQAITLTLDSLLSQHYANFEVIIVDADSTDRTLEIINNYRDSHIHIYSVSAYQRYEMLNRGISQAKGVYINFLFPGDIYLNNHVLETMMTLALNSQKPDLVYCGTILRNSSSDPKLMYHKLTLKLLQHGRQPTSLQSCWFLTNTLKKIGKFDTRYFIRGGFDLICKIYCSDGTRIASEYKVLTDSYFRILTRKMIVDHFLETMLIIRKYFGLTTFTSWLIHQKDIGRLFKLVLKNMRFAFLGK